MKVYVASSWRCDRQIEVVKRLREAGHETYDYRTASWDAGAGGGGFHWSEVGVRSTGEVAAVYLDALTRGRAQQGFSRDAEAMRRADACVLVLPCGRSAHLEAGWMAGSGKLVAVLLEEWVSDPELMYLLCDLITTSLDEVVDLLKGRLLVQEPFDPECVGCQGAEVGVGLTRVQIDDLCPAHYSLLSTLRDAHAAGDAVPGEPSRTSE